ncbi:MAG: hypothetical protein A2X45_12945 [Lentisphaerae bacterium GWF2_50_93]|nr:MAG: hypothetical protein A2X45_12945 [Lentisphaerae bacterium GWF2_50_93]
MAYLIFNDQGGRETIPVDENSEFHMGRTNDNDLTILDDPLVSRQHCRIYLHPDENKFVLGDLNSSNGTVINEETLSGEEAFLTDGDRIKVGNAEFIFCIENPERYQTTSTSIIKFGKIKQGGGEPVEDSVSQTHDTVKFRRIELPDKKDGPVISLAKLESASSLTSGMEINGYKIVRTISSNERNTIYLAFQDSVKRTVVLKIFSLRSDFEAKLSFRELVQKVGRLSSPNIIHHFDCGTFDDFCYMVLGYMSEGSLEERLSRYAPFTEKESLAMIKKVASGLNYAMTEHLLIHLNLKPENILFADSNEPVISGIGMSPWIARYFQHKRTYIFASPIYMAPEQALDHKADWRSDLYSLGIILYEMLTGKIPFTAQDEQTMINKHISEKIIFPPNLSKEAVNIIRTMTAKDPEERFASWDAFIKAISSVMDSKSKPPLHPQLGKPQPKTQLKTQLRFPAAPKKLILKK